jgi:pimeloyl-ACP methyl ester carboxylesterase
MNRNVPHSEATSVAVNGIELVYDTFGQSSAPPILLIMGLGCQMIEWEDEFCKQIAARGLFVIRFDNRDVGLSTRFDNAGIPDIKALIKSSEREEKLQVPYKLQDMAVDSVRLLDALGIVSAHIVGLSMGGGIAQIMAINHPQYVRTLTSIMYTTDDPSLPKPNPEIIELMKQIVVVSSDRETFIADHIASLRICNGSVLPFEEARARKLGMLLFDRGTSPQGNIRHYAAILASRNRKDQLKSINIPTLVIHGEVDPIVSVECGIDTADTIPNAKLVIIDGMGHDLPEIKWEEVIDAITTHAMQ